MNECFGMRLKIEWLNHKKLQNIVHTKSQTSEAMDSIQELDASDIFKSKLLATLLAKNVLHANQKIRSSYIYIYINASLEMWCGHENGTSTPGRAPEA